MFEKLFAESGLSLDRLRALLEVGACGSIVKAAENDPVRQSQYSRQIKELEDFFRSRLIERQGRGTRLTPTGKELARISRFFLRGLSNFQRGCLSEEQTFHIGSSATCLRHFIVPVLSGARAKPGATYVTEALNDPDIERRLHDLTLDFGIVARQPLSRPLQTRLLGEWKLELWLPRKLGLNEARAVEAYSERKLPLVLAREADGLQVGTITAQAAALTVDSFLDSKIALENHTLAALLPDFVARDFVSRSFIHARVSKLESEVFHFYLAWNPRMMRLNPHARKKREWLEAALCQEMA